MNRHLLKLAVIGALLSCTHHTTQPISSGTVATGICITAAAYLTTFSYYSWQSSKLEEQYEAAIDIVHHLLPLDFKKLLSRDLRSSYQQLRQLILSEHNQFCYAHTFTTPAYKNYPLLWFKKKLEADLNRLKIASYITMGTERNNEVQHLINALTIIRHVLTSDYEFIQERRHYEEVQRLDRRVI